MFAADVVWLDAYLTNVDRTPRNPNLLRWHGNVWLIDHGAALYLQHAGLDPLLHARRPFAQIADHVLLPYAGSIVEADARLAPRLSEERIADIVGAVPEAWVEGTGHAAYVEYLTRRLEAPRSSGGGRRCPVVTRSSTSCCASSRTWSAARASTRAWSSTAVARATCRRRSRCPRAGSPRWRRISSRALCATTSTRWRASRRAIRRPARRPHGAVRALRLARGAVEHDRAALRRPHGALPRPRRRARAPVRAARGLGARPGLDARDLRARRARRARPRADLDRAGAALARRGGRGARARAERDDVRDGERGGPPDRAHGAAQGPGRARVRALHEPVVAQGPRGARQPPRRAHAALAGAPAPDPRDRRGERRVRGGVRRVLGDQAARFADRRGGEPAVDGRRRRGPSWRRCGRRWPSAIPTARPCPARRTGAACGSRPTPWSCGRGARTACTTGCATGAPTRAPG